ncbi:TRAP transporter small permease [Salinicoccus sp. Marseille-QA3877]
MKRFIQNLEELIAIVSFLIMVVVVTVDVLSRIIFNYSLGFTAEISFICFSYSIMFGMVVLYRTKGLIAIGVIVDNLPEKIERIVLFFNSLFMILTSLFLAYLSYILTVNGWMRETTFLSIPYTIPYLSALVAFSLMTIYSITFLIKRPPNSSDESNLIM